MVPALEVMESASRLKTEDGLTAESREPEAANERLRIGWRSEVLAGLERGLQGWHLVSLDAPTVAAVWTWFVARCAGIELPATVPLAMFVAVWLLYATDRLLDGRARNGREDELEPRHRFHRRHRLRFGVAMVAAVAVLIPLVGAIYRLPGSAFRPFVGLGAALAGWFAVIHFARPLRRLQAAKELAPGLFFGAAVFLPALARAPELRGPLVAGAVSFGLCCWLNCLLIYRWEHAEAAAAGHAGVRWTSVLAGLLVASPLLLLAGHWARLWPVAVAVSLAAGCLLALDRVSGRLDRTTLRAAADLAMLTPLVMMPWWR